MMNITEVYSIAHNNIKGRKKIGRIISIMFFLALFIYFLVNSMAGSIDNLVELTKEMPIARTLTFIDDGELPSDFIKVCENIENVKEVYPYVFSIETEVEGLTESGRKSIDIDAFSNEYGDYIVKGNVPKENEVLIPHYMNMSTNGQYDDGSKYIGETVVVYVTNFNGEEKIFKYKVSGTYDNIYAMTGFETMFVQPVQAVNIKEYSYKGIENELAEIMEESGDYNPDHYAGFEMVYEYAVVVDSYENVTNVQNELYEKLGVPSSVEVDVSYNELQKIFDIIQFIVSILTIILLVSVIIMMVITVANDIRGRKKEMAMYLVQGYTRKNLLQILGMEYTLRFSPVLFVSTMVTIVIMMFENLVIHKLFTMEYQLFHMEYDFRTFGIGVIILLIVLATAIYNISENLKKIDLLKEIKSEG